MCNTEKVVDMKTNSYFILWILLLMFSLNGNSQFKEDLECGTEVDPDSYLHDFSYANNKKLIEIILQEISLFQKDILNI